MCYAIITPLRVEPSEQVLYNGNLPQIKLKMHPRDDLTNRMGSEY